MTVVNFTFHQYPPLHSIPFIIRGEGDELLTSSSCSPSFEGFEAIFPDSPLVYVCRLPLIKRKSMRGGSGWSKNNYL